MRDYTRQGEIARQQSRSRWTQTAIVRDLLVLGYIVATELIHQEVTDIAGEQGLEHSSTATSLSLPQGLLSRTIAERRMNKHYNDKEIHKLECAGI